MEALTSKGHTTMIDRMWGMKAYTEQKCSVCHSIAGKGNAKGVLDDVGSKLMPEEFRA